MRAPGSRPRNRDSRKNKNSSSGKRDARQKTATDDAKAAAIFIIKKQVLRRDGSSELPPTARLVAIALADEIFFLKQVVHPGPALLTAKTGLGRATVIRCLALLCSEPNPLFEKVKKGGTAPDGKREASEYRLHPRLYDPSHSDTGQAVTTSPTAPVSPPDRSHSEPGTRLMVSADPSHGETRVRGAPILVPPNACSRRNARESGRPRRWPSRQRRTSSPRARSRGVARAGSSSIGPTPAFRWRSCRNGSIEAITFRGSRGDEQRGEKRTRRGRPRAGAAGRRPALGRSRRARGRGEESMSRRHDARNTGEAWWPEWSPAGHPLFPLFPLFPRFLEPSPVLTVPGFPPIGGTGTGNRENASQPRRDCSPAATARRRPMSRSERNACRLRVAQILAKPPGARSRRAIYSDLPIREQVMQRKGSRIT